MLLGCISATVQALIVWCRDTLSISLSSYKELRPIHTAGLPCCIHLILSSSSTSGVSSLSVDGVEGRFLLTAGLDRRIAIYDTQVSITSRARTVITVCGMIQCISYLGDIIHHVDVDAVV